jgi:ribulose-phosphate 3-epimerase
MSDYIIAPSILSANFARLGEEVTQVLKAGANWIHFDVMDNHYVPNLTIGPMVCEALRAEGIKAPIDVHLMVEPVDSLIQPFAKAGASLITFHPEASKHIYRTIMMIKEEGCKVGLALNPATPVSVLEPVLSLLDLVLVMSVEPGFGGQSFIPESINRIKQVRTMIDNSGAQIYLEVDGGITPANVGQVARVGADTFVAGSAIFSAQDYTDVIAEFRQALEN